jgi:hypothetical protein
MGWTSQDDLINQITVNGKYLRRDGSKQITPASTATACWRSLMSMAGNPPAMVNSGTTLVWKSCDEFSGDGINNFGIQHGGGILSATKHIINVGFNIIAAAGGPWQAKLVDLQGYYPLTGTDVTGTGARTFVNSNTVTFTSSSGLLGTCANNWASGTKVQFTTAGVLPTGIALATDYWLTNFSTTTVKFSTSYANYVAGTYVAFTDAGTPANTMTIRMPRYTLGAGCQVGIVATTQPTAGGPNIVTTSYTNSAGTAARAFQGTPSCGATADAYAGRIIHSGLVSGRFGPFLPLQGSDAGVASIQNFTLSGGTAYTGSGVLAVCIMRPLLDLSIPITGMFSERDLVNQLPSFPQVMDGACLAWLIGSAGATTNLAPVVFNLDFGWGG